MGWVEHAKQKPEDGQHVWYFFEVTGVNYGQYDAEDDCYYGRRGWLCGDVTHWMPAPDPPRIGRGTTLARFGLVGKRIRHWLGEALGELIKLIPR